MVNVSNMATRRITFRLYPKKQQANQLHQWRKLHQYVYNACIYERRIQYKRFGNSVTYYDQQNLLPAFKRCWPEFKELGSHALQATVKRVDFAYQRFFNQLGGKPKFKSIRRYRGWTYPCNAGWKVTTNGENGYLNLTNLGNIQMRGKARTWGTPKTCTIIWKDNKWYASITVNCKPNRETEKNAVGLDFGTYHAIATSDGTLVDNPRFERQIQEKIKKASRKLRKKRAPNKKKKIKASKRWRKFRQQVSKLQNKVANRRQDWQHKVASEIVSSNSLVATEKLNLKGMTKKAKKGSKRKRQKIGLNRSLLDVGISNIISLIKYKLNECDGIFVEVPTTKVAPSQTCPDCGKKRKKELSERVHNCDCGCTLDRDVAASKVMLHYALGLGTSLVKRGVKASTSIPTYCGGFKQASTMKRQKPPSQL